MLFSHLYNSPVGNIGLLKKDEKLICLSFTNHNFTKLKPRIDIQSFKEIIKQLNEYFFEGRKTFDIQSELSTTNFRSNIYEEIKKISYGNTITYTDLAIKAGSPKAFRAAGTACGKNPLPLIIPCHRVQAKSGIGGFTGGLGIKKFLLELETN